ncbi:hypothetical protein LQW54_008179 [Pestalotiopsis sp. IQ-011]
MSTMKSTSTLSSMWPFFDESETTVPISRPTYPVHDLDDDDEDDMSFSDDDDDDFHRFNAKQRSAAPSPELPDTRPSSSRTGTSLRQNARHPYPEPRPRRIEALRTSPPSMFRSSPRSSSSSAPYPRRPGPSSRSTTSDPSSRSMSSGRSAASSRVSALYLRSIGGLGSALPRLDPRVTLGINPGRSSSSRLKPVEPRTWTTFEAEEWARWRPRDRRSGVRSAVENSSVARRR